MSQEIIPEEPTLEVRRVWYEGEWWYTVVDFIALWVESTDPAR